VPLSSSVKLTAFAMTQQRILHTYVTSSCGASWGCWGGYQGGLNIRHGTGSSILADCIGQPNVGPGFLSRGIAGIVYGVNGVCHQMANRILSVANIELPLGFAQIRASRFTYRGGAFGRNLPGQPIDDQWPGRQIACKRPPLPSSSGSVGPSGSSGNLSSSRWSGLMSSITGANDDSDPRSELFALIEAASLGHTIAHQKLEALLEVQENLRANQEQLAQWLIAERISKLDYVAKLDAAMQETARAGEEILGFEDFHRVFGDFNVDSIIDVKAFVGDGGALFAR
jgi:hypothetical protein